VSTRTTAARPARAAGATKAAKPCLIVGYDGSAGSRAAIDWASAAMTPAGRIVIVYSCRPLHAPARHSPRRPSAGASAGRCSTS
jgi:hypothetical protein